MSFSIKHLVPQALEPIAKAAYYKAFRLILRTNMWCVDRLNPWARDRPVPPAALRFRVSELLSVRAFLDIGAGCATLIREQVTQSGIDFANARRVLDFGCGCGRTIRWFLCEDSGAEFHGVDIDSDSIEWCKKFLPQGNFEINAATPPLPYPGKHFDVVYCLSVFTHLSESMQDIWLAELRRILKPGGGLLLTVYGAAAAKVLSDHDRMQLAQAGFLHKQSQKLKGLVPDWYQTSFHTREYILQRLSRGFDDVRYAVIPDGMQDVVVARKNRS